MAMVVHFVYQQASPVAAILEELDVSQASQSAIRKVEATATFDKLNATSTGIVAKDPPGKRKWSAVTQQATDSMCF